MKSCMLHVLSSMNINRLLKGVYISLKGCDMPLKGLPLEILKIE